MSPKTAALSPKTATLSPKPATIRQHCCQKHNVASFGDIVAGFGDNVAVFGDIVAGVDGALRTASKDSRGSYGGDSPVVLTVVSGTVSEARGHAGAVVVVVVEDPVESAWRRSSSHLAPQVDVAIADERRRCIARDARTVYTTRTQRG